MKLLMLDDFAPHVNSTFTAALTDSNVEFVLVEARPLPPSKFETMRAPFVLLFRNGAALLFPQQTYAMRHSSLGEFAIFLVPIAREREGFLYEAIFT